VRLLPTERASRYGWTTGRPLLDARLGDEPVGRPGDHEIWHIRRPVEGPRGPVRINHRLTRTETGSLVIQVRDASIRVDPSGREIFVEAETEGLGEHLVVTYGLPLLLHSTPAVLLHACAAVRPGGEEADLFCAKSGTGKSTLLAGLIGAGWRPVTEDVAVVDIRHPDAPVVWPGPPWVRVAGNGPAGSDELFTVNDKTSWDISAVQVHSPVAVRRVVFLDAPAGSSPAWTSLDRRASIGALPQHMVWIAEPDQKAAAVFGPTVALASRVSAARLRLPRANDWVERADAMLRSPPG